MNIPHNPLLPTRYYLPDTEARVFDGRLYLYGTYERCDEDNWFSIKEMHVFSTEDFINFTDHGIVFSADGVTWNKSGNVWAPDCVYYRGKYYLFYCCPDDGQGGGCGCGVAVGDTPYGPFDDLGKVLGTDAIDPAVLIDGDNAYIYWGQNDDVKVARLTEDLTAVIPETVCQPLTSREHYYHEGISIRKINGRYHLTYTEKKRHGKRATAQGYAVSDYPTHGFVYRGTVIDNFGSDKMSWNNHGSIECFKGVWYVFYHRSTESSSAKRQLCCEPIALTEDGYIAEVEPSSSGPSSSIAATHEIPAYIAATHSGSLAVMRDEASPYGISLRGISAQDSALFRYIRFKGENTVEINYTMRESEFKRIDYYQIPRAEIYFNGKYYATVEMHPGKGIVSSAALEKAIFGTGELVIKFFGQKIDADLYSLKFSVK